MLVTCYCYCLRVLSHCH